MSKSKVIKINGNESNYMITDNGKVYSLNYMNTGKKHRLKTRIDKDGYEIVTIYYNGKRFDRKVHRLVAEAFIKNPYNKPEVNHKNGIKNCNNVKNLEWATNLENIHHSWESGLSKPMCGQYNPASKHSDEEIATVCKLIESNKYTFKEISNITNVNKDVIKGIFHRNIWKQLSKNYDFSKFTKFECKRLDDKLVHKICKSISKGKMTLKEIAVKFNVPYKSVRNIYSGMSYKSISDKYNFNNYKKKG